MRHFLVMFQIFAVFLTDNFVIFCLAWSPYLLPGTTLATVGQKRIFLLQHAAN